MIIPTRPLFKPDRAIGRALVAAGLISLLAVGPPLARGAELPDRSDRVRIAQITPETEEAINKALRWLAKAQNADGSWGGDHKAGLTSLALMAFMVQGHFPGRPPYGDEMTKGVDFLLKEAKKGGGYIGPNMYDHGFATLALSEVWGMSDRDDIRDTLKRAVEIILRAQDPTGGWRYNPEPCGSDVSVTVTQVVALASAKEAGIYVPDKTMERAVAFVKTLSYGRSGFLYAKGGVSTNFARTACGVMALLIAGDRENMQVQGGLEYMKYVPSWTFEGYGNVAYYYGHFYAIQAMYQAGERHYQEWYPKVRDDLLKKQDPSGRWSKFDYHGNATAMAVLTLGVPYRFLPIYQR